MDPFIAGLFASLAEGSVMVTLAELRLGLTQREANEWRAANGLKPSANASFFEVTKVKIGEAGQLFASTSCETAPAYAFVYKRVRQQSNLRGAVTLCRNLDCHHLRNGDPIAATSINSGCRVVVGTCECGVYVPSSGKVKTMSYSDYVHQDDDWGDWGAPET
jgi:hypothetical protein